MKGIFALLVLLVACSAHPEDTRMGKLLEACEGEMPTRKDADECIAFLYQTDPQFAEALDRNYPQKAAKVRQR